MLEQNTNKFEMHIFDQICPLLILTFQIKKITFPSLVHMFPASDTLNGADIRRLDCRCTSPPMHICNVRTTAVGPDQLTDNKSNLL